jgi:hypothetical protein
LSRVRLLSAIIPVALLAVFIFSAVQPVYTQEVLPDNITFVDGPTVLQAGNSYVIDIQLTVEGANYAGNNYAVFFQTSNSSLIDIPRGQSVVTNDRGRASFNITAGEGYGNVTVTASLLSPGNSIRGSKTYTVVAFSNVRGSVLEAGGSGIPGATVTLYSMEAGEKGAVLSIAGNPVTTSENGAYAIDNVPYGSYVIEAAADGQNATANLTVSSASQVEDILIPGYVVPTPTPTPTPTPAPGEEPSPTATPVSASPSPAPKTPTGDTTRQLIWIVGVALVLAAIIIGVQTLRQRKLK